MDLIIRPMKSDEVGQLKALCRRAFGLEGLLTPKPKIGLVAVYDEKIVGGFNYTVHQCKDKKVGVVDLLYTDPNFQGAGIGKRLCEEGLNYLWKNEGCNLLITFVRGDNAASWGIFEKNGFVRADLLRSVELVGLADTLKLHIKTMYGLAPGHDFYLALKDNQDASHYSKNEGINQVAVYLAVNIVFAAMVLLQWGNAVITAAALGFVLLGGIIAGYIGTLFSKRKWKFRMTSGGWVISILVSTLIRNCFPMIGGWYPERYENSSAFKRDMAVTTMFRWAFMLAVPAINLLFGTEAVFMSFASAFASFFLIIKCIPIPTFDSFGGWRVFAWNKAAFGLFAAISILLVFVL